MVANADLYCFDTFEGFVMSDITMERQATTLGVSAGTFSDTSLDIVKSVIGGGKPCNNLILRKGIFPETFKGVESKKWRFVHLDCDLYAPTKEGLGLFWPNIVQGGILLVHDYNAGYLGVKKAVDEYFLPLGIIPVPLCDKVGSAVIIKHN